VNPAPRLRVEPTVLPEDVDPIDDLTEVLDDAVLKVEPASSDPVLTTTCAVGDALRTDNPVSRVTVVESVDPADGSTVEADDLRTYRLLHGEPGDGSLRRPATPVDAPPRPAARHRRAPVHRASAWHGAVPGRRAASSRGGSGSPLRVARSLHTAPCQERRGSHHPTWEPRLASSQPEISARHDRNTSKAEECRTMQGWDKDSDVERFVQLLRTLTDGVGGPGAVVLPLSEPPVTSPRDLGEMTEEFYEAMVEADVREAMREFELPHVVVCFDRVTGYLTVEGPYEDGLTASRLAEEDANADRLVGTGFTYLVLPLLPRRHRDD
jgi:hypothetical protein